MVKRNSWWPRSDTRTLKSHPYMQKNRKKPGEIENATLRPEFVSLIIIVTHHYLFKIAFGRGGVGGINWEYGINRGTLLYIK